MNAKLTAPSQAAPEDDFHWVALSDLMSSLMMMFLFLALLHMLQVERTHAVETAVRMTAVESRQAIYQALDTEFRTDLVRWNAEFDRPTLTLRFREPDVLFDRNSARIKPEFEAILRDFLPRYVAQLRPFRAVIREIRIEGHTSSEWQPGTRPLDAYFANLELSQQRIQSVLRFAYGLDRLQPEQWFRERIAAVGLSSSRPVRDASGREDAPASRRVEFSVATDFEARLLEPIKLNDTPPGAEAEAIPPAAAAGASPAA